MFLLRPIIVDEAWARVCIGVAECRGVLSGVTMTVLRVCRRRGTGVPSGTGVSSGVNIPVADLKGPLGKMTGPLGDTSVCRGDDVGTDTVSSASSAITSKNIVGSLPPSPLFFLRFLLPLAGISLTASASSRASPSIMYRAGRIFPFLREDVTALKRNAFDIP